MKDSRTTSTQRADRPLTPHRGRLAPHQRPLGTAICSGYSICKYGALPEIPSLNYLAFTADLFVLFFWIFGINTNVSELAAKRYAEAMIMAIDTIEKK